MSNRKPTAAKMSSNPLRAFPTRYSRSGMSAKSTASVSLPCSFFSCFPMALMSARACSSDAPGRRRAIAFQLWAVREISGGYNSRGIQTSAFCGKLKPGGITPTTLKLRPSTFRIFPAKSVVLPSKRCQKPKLTTATAVPPRLFSSALKTRPMKGCTARTRKKSLETPKVPARTGSLPPVTVISPPAYCAIASKLRFRAPTSRKFGSVTGISAPFSLTSVTCTMLPAPG